VNIGLKHYCYIGCPVVRLEVFYFTDIKLVSACVCVRVCAHICVEGLKEATINLSQNDDCRDSSRQPLRYES
jgi:hypothetical protein